MSTGGGGGSHPGQDATRRDITTKIVSLVEGRAEAVDQFNKAQDAADMTLASLRRRLASLRTYVASVSARRLVDRASLPLFSRVARAPLLGPSPRSRARTLGLLARSDPRSDPCSLARLLLARSRARSRGPAIVHRSTNSDVLVVHRRSARASEASCFAHSLPSASLGESIFICMLRLGEGDSESHCVPRDYNSEARQAWLEASLQDRDRIVRHVALVEQTRQEQVEAENTLHTLLELKKKVQANDSHAHRMSVALYLRGYFAICCAVLTRCN